MICGDVCNDHGDLFYGRTCRPLMEGAITVSLGQAMRAMPHGWRLIWADDGDTIHIQRGGPAWKGRG